MKGDGDVLVIGAGVVGVTTALALIERGRRVTLVDAAEGPGLGTSYANGAQLSYAYTDALASPAMVAQMPRLIAAADPAFRLRPSLDPDFLRWGLAFLRNATATRFHRNTIAGLTLAIESRLALHGLVERHGIEFAHATPGKLHIYRNAKGLAAAAELAAIKRTMGFDQHVLGVDEAVAAEPMLDAIRRDMAGALHTPEEEVGDPYRFCLGALAALKASERFTGCFRSRVSRIDARGGRPAVVTDNGGRIDAATIILCAGADAAKLARTAGARLPIQPMKGYSLTAPPGAAAPEVSITDVSNRVVFARLGNRMRIAGLADLGVRDRRVDPRRFAALVGSARAALPGAADYDNIEQSWAGLRPMTPDSLPIIRKIAPGVFANAGHGALGWTYAAGAAERVARLIGEGN
ncbi:FAD-dependent oxidoreductase [Sphingomonas gilva]|uniref:FAD-dependent oxidoreductase n=1 Tax=Sphingomonas gilva TaxID=2305907 RepID=A0A396RLW4_9SPHN|nr:FAD-dependent oxidoreductase [Sphingomonas gilva]RHW17350.1 FAD-dependent oxidoreductase [Sphingomonas gilva]